MSGPGVFGHGRRWMAFCLDGEEEALCSFELEGNDGPIPNKGSMIILKRGGSVEQQAGRLYRVTGFDWELDLRPDVRGAVEPKLVLCVTVEEHKGRLDAAP